jgi:hypothetical protein
MFFLSSSPVAIPLLLAVLYMAGAMFFPGKQAARQDTVAAAVHARAVTRQPVGKTLDMTARQRRIATRPSPGRAAPPLPRSFFLPPLLPVLSPHARPPFSRPPPVG